MKHYKVVSSPLFIKQFKKLDKSVQVLVAKYIKTYLDGCSDPKEKGKALVGDKKGLWRYRIADYRLICEIDENKIIIIVLNIGHHREIYRK